MDANATRLAHIARRTFEARRYPKGSPERRALNESPLTSEYLPSQPFALIACTGHVTFRTRRAAEAHATHCGLELPS